MLGRHRERDTWEMQGGHIEANETPLEAAGMVFAAEIKKLGILPDFEIAEVKLFDELPDNLTYPELTRILFDYLKNNNKN